MKRLLPVVLLCIGGYGAIGQRPASGTDDAIPHGSVSHHVYTTSIGVDLPGNREDYYVYTPPGYEPSSTSKYPVLYLLHGFNQNPRSWLEQGNFQNIIDTLIIREKARPMIVVLPLGYGDFKFLQAGKPVWLFPAKVNENVALFSRMLLNEIIPQVESEYKVSRKREDRAIAGLSMGGREAISIGLENPKKFAWVGGFSAAFPDVQRFLIPAYRRDDKAPQTFWVACGVADREFVFKGNMRVIADMNQQGRTVTTVVTHGLHDWPVWRKDLEQFAPLLFK